MSRQPRLDAHRCVLRANLDDIAGLPGEIFRIERLQGQMETGIADAARIVEMAFAENPARVAGLLPVWKITATTQLAQPVLPMTQGPVITVIDLDHVEHSLRTGAL